MGLTARVRRRILEDFPGRDGQAVDELLAELVDFLIDRGDRESKERIAAAVLLCARHRVDRFLDAVQLAMEDWRDLLVDADLADEDWAEKLNSEFGPAS